MKLRTETQIEIRGIPVVIVRKRIKNMYLRVYPPNGMVKATVPLTVTSETLTSWIDSRWDWLQIARERAASRNPHQERDSLNRPVHLMLFGYTYKIAYREIEIKSKLNFPEISRELGMAEWNINPSIATETLDKTLQSFYAKRLEPIARNLIEIWEEKMNLSSGELHLRWMKTRWGTCKPSTGKITLNSALAQAQVEQIEYVVVHELAHLLEPSHNARFKAIMTSYLPDWKARKKMLNLVPTVL